MAKRLCKQNIVVPTLLLILLSLGDTGQKSRLSWHPHCGPPEHRQNWRSGSRHCHRTRKTTTSCRGWHEWRRNPNCRGPPDWTQSRSYRLVLAWCLRSCHDSLSWSCHTGSPWRKSRWYKPRALEWLARHESGYASLRDRYPERRG